MVEIKNSVIKFGGTSVANESKIIRKIVSENNPRYVVVSAPGKRNPIDTKVTDLLIELNSDKKQYSISSIIERFEGIGDDSKLAELEEELKLRCNQDQSSQRYEDIISFGEWASAKVLAPVLNLPFYDSKDFIEVEDKKFRGTFNIESIPEFAVIPGFYGSNLEYKIETLSRGGSDLTGAIIAQAFNLPYHNFTDSPIKAIDPRLIENPKEISEMSYRELRYLTLSGFSIIHQDVWYLMEESRLPLIVRSTKDYPSNGTLVANERLLRSNKPITGISYQDNFLLITVDSKNTSNQGFDISLYQEFDKHKINITTTAGGLTDTSFLLDKKQLSTRTLNELISEFTTKGYGVEIKDNLACMVIVGEELKNTRGILGIISSIIGNSRNNISFVSQSGCEKSIIYAITGGNDGKETLQTLYSHFFK